MSAFAMLLLTSLGGAIAIATLSAVMHLIRIWHSIHCTADRWRLGRIAPDEQPCHHNDLHTNGTNICSR